MELRSHSSLFLLFTLLFSLSDPTSGIRIADPIRNQASRPVKTALFALGSFWRSEAAFGCIPGVVRTSVGYSGGSKSNPEFRNLGDHAECVQVEYDPNVIQYKQLLDVFWASHDSRQVFGQGPDVGNQYRSIIFTNGTLEARLAAASKEREQTKSRISIVTTQIQHLGAFHLAESDHQDEPSLFPSSSDELYVDPSVIVIHVKELGTINDAFILFLRSSQLKFGLPFIPMQMPIVSSLLPPMLENGRLSLQKFELKRNRFLLQLIGNMPDEELLTSSLAAKLNGYAAELCPPAVQKKINAKIDDILKSGWPVLRNI